MPVREGDWVSTQTDHLHLLSLEVRSGYRIQASQQDDSMRVLYYMEKELANFDPSRPGPPSSRVERGEEPWSLRGCRGGGGTSP